MDCVIVCDGWNEEILSSGVYVIRDMEENVSGRIGMWSVCGECLGRVFEKKVWENTGENAFLECFSEKEMAGRIFELVREGYLYYNMILGSI